MIERGDKISRPTPAVFTVSRRIPHHAEHSGYDQLARYVGHPVNTPPFLHRIRGLGPLHRYFRERSGMEWYDGLYAEMVTSFHMRRHGPSIYHFLFAERDYRYMPILKPVRQHKLIGSFHAAPEEFFRVMKKTEHLKSLNAAVIVAKNLKRVLEPILGKEKIFYVPHGVDTVHFSPPNRQRTASKVCISVGHHHRDFETFARVAAIVAKKDSEVRFVAVDRVFSLYFTEEEQRKIRESFASAGNAKLETNLTDAGLLELYRTSDLMVLPLLEATANVALLEAISCGLPVVTSDIEGVRDYISRNEGMLIAQRDPERMADAVLRLLADHQERQTLGIKSRAKSLEFDWQVIAGEMTRVYNTITLSDDRHASSGLRV